MIRHEVSERVTGSVRTAVCSCGDESFPIADGWTLEEVAAGHALNGVVLPAPSWGYGPEPRRDRRVRELREAAADMDAAGELGVAAMFREEADRLAAL